ncbi:hypothetical protein RY831_16355 [Noviherbaspirillum sp. CPCC 100848]|uniref:Uncharacterized protein n=1 Tax=Noviherbaspirillum album TaxID=3080276 RepID=A0ABU6JAR0_9BURK|nr:hypothetical protein [Noviherbaspirillum sp. CPCC 100848]MEC4720737.1 hypothetical protein [Noviherbaspirillum sp. CPCC 100848]
MSDSTQMNTEELIKKADELVRNVRSQLESGEEFFRQQGLDPQKVRSVLESQMTSKDKEEAAALARADMAAVEQEVAEEMARARFAKGGAAPSVKRPRTIV